MSKPSTSFVGNVLKLVTGSAFAQGMGILIAPIIARLLCPRTSSLGIPMSLVSGAVAQVFFQKASEAHNRTGNPSEVVEEVFKRLVSLGILPILLLTLIGEDFLLLWF